MAPEAWAGILAGLILVFIFLFKTSTAKRSRKLLRMDMESENNHLRQIVAQMSIDRHLSGRRR